MRDSRSGSYALISFDFRMHKNEACPQTCPLREEVTVEFETAIDKLVAEYLASHPDFRHPPSGDSHASILAMTEDIKVWMMEMLGGPLPYWKLMIEAGKRWFTPESNDRLCRVFCVRLEAEANTFWNGRPEYEALLDEYAKWRKLGPYRKNPLANTEN